MEVRTWEFTDRAGETRRYEQTELTIDGEMMLLRFATEAGLRLRDAKFPFERLGGLWPDPDDLTRIDIGLVAEMLTVLAGEAADLLTRGAAILLSVWEFDENRKRNQSYADELAFLRRVLHTADVVEMIETFIDQNDVERLRRPFSRALSLYGGATIPTTTAEITTGRSTFSPPPATETPTPSVVATPGPMSTTS